MSTVRDIKKYFVIYKCTSLKGFYCSSVFSLIQFIWVFVLENWLVGIIAQGIVDSPFVSNVYTHLPETTTKKIQWKVQAV